MAMVNSKGVQRILEMFQKDYGREPTMREMNLLMNGKNPFPKKEKAEEKK